MCAKTGEIVRRVDAPSWWAFTDRSWPCPCGSIHCSECYYTSDGMTIIVEDCGRFD